MPERTYRIGPEGLRWTSYNGEHRVLYRDVCDVRIYRMLARGEAMLKGRTMTRLQLRCRSGQKVTLSPLHYTGFRNYEDRSSAYSAFTGALLARLRSNSDLKIITEVDWRLRVRHAITRSLPPLLGRFGEKLFNLINRFGLDRTARFGGRLMRVVGPWLPAHRFARANLEAAFPEKSDHDVDVILRGVWDNFGRLVAEYAFTDELYDYDPLRAVNKRVILDQDVIQRLFALRDKGEPVLFFSAHLGSWELAPLAAAFGIPMTAVYRPFNSEALNDLTTKMRSRINLIPARFGALVQLENSLRQGSSIGMLVDQHFAGGVDVVFFGRQCKVNPTLGILARKYGCPIHGARVIRLPDGRFRGDVTSELKPPRDDEGKIDIAGTMQMITGVVEAWVREHPEQWLWLHRRWR
jgi:Kdo2-lipid IVA lauroyltransferase/acyltransferase